MIKSKQLAQAFFELSKEENKDLDLKFIDFIKRNKLESHVPYFIYHLEKIVNKEIHKDGLQVEIAHKIKDETLKKIKEKLGLYNVPETIVFKKELIGGFRVKRSGVVYDLSISNSLKKLEETIIN